MGARRLRLHSTARKHYTRDRLHDSDVLHAAEHVVHAEPLDDDDDPRRWLLLGVDPAGRILELVVLVFDSETDTPLLIHAMKARPQYLDLL